ncbi:MAG: DegQ family serine endoprotease [Candidatus Rokubacteria bacterium]|nr:DegQ family serine endoprotease [Candidatus Rokubacteria bacterium]
MRLQIRRHPTLWRLAALGIALSLVALVPRLGFTKVEQGSVWTERQAAPVPAAAQSPAPWVELARQLKPAVVNISTKRVQEMGTPFQGPLGHTEPFNEFFKQFFGRQPRRTVKSLGSGFAINPNGYILTNNHVVDGATEIRVTLADGRELPGKVLGRDAKTDLALVKIEASGLPVIPLGSSAALQVGEPVMAIGNPFGLEQTVTTGIVSATGRVIGEGPYDDFIQTDASINPGNSGGPLINARGEAVGINAAIFTQSGGSVGIGFAIPSNLAKSVVSQLAEAGHVVRGWLGVAIQPLTPELARGFGLPDAHGALVASVAPDSPALKAGIKSGDIITAFNGSPIRRSEELPRAVAATPVGSGVAVTVLRDGKPLGLTARIAQLAEPQEQVVGERPGTGSLGLAVQPITPEQAREMGLGSKTGVLVRGVEDGSRAAGAGIQPGDVIVEVDRHPIGNVRDLRRSLEEHHKGTPTLFLVHRDGESLYLALGS